MLPTLVLLSHILLCHLQTPKESNRFRHVTHALVLFQKVFCYVTFKFLRKTIHFGMLPMFLLLSCNLLCHLQFPQENNRFRYVTYAFAVFYDVFCYVTFKFQRKTLDFVMLPMCFLCFYYNVFCYVTFKFVRKIIDFVMLPMLLLYCITQFAMPPSNS